MVVVVCSLRYFTFTLIANCRGRKASTPTDFTNTEFDGSSSSRQCDTPPWQSHCQQSNTTQHKVFSLTLSRSALPLSAGCLTPNTDTTLQSSAGLVSFFVVYVVLCSPALAFRAANSSPDRETIRMTRQRRKTRADELANAVML